MSAIRKRGKMDAGDFTKQSLGSIGEVEVRIVSLVRGDAGEVAERLGSTAFYRRDRAGNLIESVCAIPEKYTSRTTQTYDAENRLIETASYNESDGSLFGRTEFSYDRAGRLTEKRFYDGCGVLQNAIRSVYTPEGFRVENEIQPVFDNDDTEVIHQVELPNAPNDGSFVGVSFSARRVRRLRKIFDPTGNLLEISLYRARNKPAGKIFIAYDENKRPTHVSQYGVNEMFLCNDATRWQRLLSPVVLRLFDFYLRLKTICAHAVRREFQKARRCLLFGALYRETRFFYDAAGQIIEQQILFAVGPELRKHFFYDDRGNKTEAVTDWSGDFFSERERHEYEYDARGNWIKKTSFHRFPSNSSEQLPPREFASITYRAINYRSDERLADADG